MFKGKIDIVLFRNDDYLVMIPNKTFCIVNFISNFEIENFHEVLNMIGEDLDNKKITSRILKKYEKKCQELIDTFITRGSLMSKKYYNRYFKHKNYKKDIWKTHNIYEKVSKSNKRIFHE